MRSVSPELILALPPSTLRAPFDALGPPRGLRADARLLDAARTLFTGRAALELPHALDDLAWRATMPRTLGTTGGRVRFGRASAPLDETEP